MPELVHTEKPLTDEEFTTFERLFHRKIPLSFKRHYMADNGGSPSEEDVEAGKWGLPVHGFNSIKYGGLTIEELVERIGTIDPEDDKFGSWAKFSYIPFAHDAGANIIFLSLKDSDYGSVYITNTVSHAPVGGSIYMITRSFEEFRARLYQSSTDRRS
jgi:hypothetical protein